MTPEIVGFDALNPALTNQLLREYLDRFPDLQPYLARLTAIEYTGQREHRTHFNPGSFVLQSGQAYPGYLTGRRIAITPALPPKKMPDFVLRLVGEFAYQHLDIDATSTWIELHSEGPRDRRNFVSPVAALTPLDDFMECFAYFLLDPRRVMVTHLGKYTFIRERVFLP